MTQGAAAAKKRERPAEGGMVWHARIHAFECLGCGEFEALCKRRQYDDAEFVMRMRELFEIDHAECWEFDDPEMARNARRYRKEKKRRELLAAQGLAR